MAENKLKGSKKGSENVAEVTAPIVGTTQEGSENVAVSRKARVVAQRTGRALKFNYRMRA